jgi:hypothetical protein
MVLDSLPTAAARTMENAIRRAGAEEKRYRAHVLLAADPDASIETLAEPEIARWGRGAGGGRRRRPAGHGPDG